MPPRRRAPPVSTEAEENVEMAAETSEDLTNRKLERWSRISGSKNAARGYFQMVEKDPTKAYSFYTLCKPLHHLTPEENPDYDSDADESEEDDDMMDEDEDEEWEDVDDSEGRVGPKCKRKNCICFLPANENPDHQCVISFGGFCKFTTQIELLQLRDPDVFSMHTYNDHANMGVLEVLENLLLDFEMDDDMNQMDEWRERWSICEATVQLLMSEWTDNLNMFQDGDRLVHMMQLIGRQFLNMLAQLDSKGLLSDSSPILSLPFVMASYMRLANIQRQDNLLGDSTEQEPYGQDKLLQPTFYDDAILSYANERGIMLGGFKNIDDMCAECVPEVNLPDKDQRDPWGYKQCLEEYKASHSTSPDGKTIGGDNLDVTSWSAVERRQYSFNGKDPMTKKDLTALKEGLIMTLG
ncbi:hypothetical protein F5Y18DRAFT_383076 [Xylariaceae sp. FL1019]|nr:hypothetical protein F5Y18DRAFT_383076 [Xylariaceae sp. FL1019]